MHYERDPFREFEFPNVVEVRKKRFLRFRRIFKNIYKGLTLTSPIAGTLALLLVAIGLFFGYPVYKNFNYTNPSNDGYVAPRSPGDIVAIAEASTITVECKLSPDNFVIGSGWSIDLKPSSKRFKSSIITNHHVIEDCLGGKGALSIVDEDLKHYEVSVDILGQEWSKPRLLGYDIWLF
jgi:hypothetical protein